MKDAYNNLAIAYKSLVLKGKISTFIPGAKVVLPFYVYNDSWKMPYVPTAYMGDFDSLKCDAQNTEQVHSGKQSIKISYNREDGWFGVGFVDPANDWGNRPGGYSVKGATVYSFWAKSTVNDVEITIGFGMIGADKPYYDTSKEAIKIKLTQEWKKYEIPLTKDMDLRCIRSGVVIYGGGIEKNYSFWIDEVGFF